MMYVMSGNKPVVEFDGNTYEYDILDKALAPLYITNRGNIRRWIEERAMDPTRANSRAVKSVQGLSKNASDYVTAMKVDAATITDDYWIKDSNDTRSYEDIMFQKNDFFSLALARDNQALNKKASRTPELTNIGQQEKGWRLEQGEWWLYKNEPEKEIVSEYITCLVGKALGYDMADYFIENNSPLFIKSRSFTGQTYNLHHIDGIMIDHMEGERFVTDDDYGYNYRTFYEISPQLASQYLDICALDAICENFDRHTKNYGILTERKTGKIVRLAPNYDNNNSLLANTNLSLDRNSGVMRMFLNFIEKEGIAVSVPQISQSAIKDIVDHAYSEASYFQSEIDLSAMIINGIDLLSNHARLPITPSPTPAAGTA